MSCMLCDGRYAGAEQLAYNRQPRRGFLLEKFYLARLERLSDS
jgi:hypothetical protein